MKDREREREAGEKRRINKKRKHILFYDGIILIRMLTLISAMQ